MSNEHIDHILATAKTIAVVGLSSKKVRAGYYVSAYLQENGYRIVPVNPYLDESLGEKAYPDLFSVPESVDLVLLFRRSSAISPHVTEAIEIRAKSVWMQLGIINEAAAASARSAGLQVVMDKCMLVEHQRWQAV